MNFSHLLLFLLRRKLDKNKMIRFDERTGYLHATDLGRTASQFYINHETIEVFNEMMKPVMKEDEILDMLSRAQESCTADYETSCTSNIGYSDTIDNLHANQMHCTG